MTLFSSYITPSGANGTIRRSGNSHLHRVCRESIIDAEVQARLALRHEVNARMSCSRVGNKAPGYRSLAHLALLQALPAVGMGENEFNMVLDRIPDALSVAVRLADVAASTCEEVAEEIGEDCDHGLVGRQRREVLLGDRTGAQPFRAQVQLEPGGGKY